MMPGFLIAMIIWNKGCIRAYAIGALATLLGSTWMLSQQVLLAVQVGRGAPYNFPWMIGAQWSMVIMGGLVPAVYVAFLKRRGQSLGESRRGR
jgi:hypothetical protein